MKKDKRKIPKGYYCYDIKNGKRIICPYWSLRKNKPYQFNGYCSYLEKGDWELTKEKEKSGRWREGKTGRFMKGPKGFPLSVLWDMCKECGVNE